ncbi:MAG: ABC transporter permease [Planctomycetes bacterium]|nr:ABC transporter permease [Planctomycetota bacterium]
MVESQDAKQPDASELERYAALLDEARRIKGTSLWQDAWRRLKRNRLAMISLWCLVAVAMLAAFAPLLPLQSPLDKDLKDRKNLAPGFRGQRYWVKLGERSDLRFASDSLTAELAKFDDEVAELKTKVRAASGTDREQLLGELDGKIHNSDPLEKLWHNPGSIVRQLLRLRIMLFGDWCLPSLFGTDDLGRDVLSRVFWGARVSLIVGIVATLVSLLIGVTYGAVSGYLGGWIDSVMMRIVDILYSIPFIFIVIFIITILSAEETKAKMDALGINQLTVFYVLIGAIYWLTMARVVRGQVISLKTELFIDAAHVVGASRARIVFQHLIPNVMSVVIVYLTLTIPAVMRFEAFLSFLGVGVQAPDVSWGLLVDEGVKAVTPIKIYWWLIAFSGGALAATLFSLNFLGDGLRDALDPRMKNR